MSAAAKCAAGARANAPSVRMRLVGSPDASLGPVRQTAPDARRCPLKSLQKFASVHASVHNLFALERHLISREVYKERRSAALAEWQSLMD